MYIERYDRNLDVTSMVIHLSIDEEDRLAFALLKADPEFHELIFGLDAE